MSSSCPASSEVSQTLAAVAATIATLGAGLLATGTAANAQIPQIGQSVQAIEQGHTPAPRFRVVDISPDVVQAVVRRATIPVGGLDVEVDVQLSAQRAVLYLWLEDDYIPELPGTLTMQIGGNLGLTEFTFASGTTISEIRTSVNGSQAVTGLEASIRTLGSSVSVLCLKSIEPGAHAFVSVRVLQASGDWSSPRGIYRAHAQGEDMMVPSSRTPVNNPFPRFDVGQNLFAYVNGMPVPSVGATLYPHLAHLDADIQLGLGWSIQFANAQTLGSFRAFRVVRSP